MKGGLPWFSPLALPTPRERPPRIGWLPSWGPCLYTDEVVDSHQIMMMNDYMPTKVNDLYKVLFSLG